MKPTLVPERARQNSLDRTATGQTELHAQATAPIRGLSKDHADYWLSRLQKRSYTNRGGQVVEVPDWQVRLWKDGREAWFNLGTPNRSAAAKKAKEVFAELQKNGLEAALRLNGGVTQQSSKVTVGEYLQAVRATGKLRLRTFLNYQTCLRTVIAGIFGVKYDKGKFDYKTGGNQKWAERIDCSRLERVTPERVAAWQRAFIKRAGNSPLAIASAKRTTNSYLRCSRSLFSTKLRKAMKGLKLPAVLPFDGVELSDSGSMKYISRINVQTLIAAARAELKPSDPEAYKVFLLGLLAGMRKAEIDLAEWRMVDWENHVIRLEETQWLRLKTRDSAAEITIDQELSAELREFKAVSKSAFIISSDRLPRNDSARVYYRCDHIFDRLTAWLRGKGVKANKPLHELRKEIGALVATEHGIFAASRFLRHSDLATTAKHYAQHKERITVGLGKLLDTEVKTVPAAAPVAATH